VRALGAIDGRLLVVTDFDGTLSPIVRDPMAARIEPGARSALRRLARFAATDPGRLSLVVLSGRAASDVARRVRVGGIRYLGNHGLESGLLRRGVPAERVQVSPDLTIGQGGVGTPDSADVAAFGAELRDRLGHPDWLFVEDKGPSVAFHFRQADDPAAARAAVLAALDGSGRAGRLADGRPIPALERLEGRQVVELRPAGAGGKGAAMGRLIASERPRAILTMGDDVSDAEAFQAVIAAREVAPTPGRPPTDGLVVAVHGRAETPADVLAAADLLVAAPRDAARVLAELARVLIDAADRGAADRGAADRSAAGRLPG